MFSIILILYQNFQRLGMRLHIYIACLDTNNFNDDVSYDFAVNPTSRHSYNYFDEDYVPGECGAKGLHRLRELSENELNAIKKKLL